MRRNTNLDPVVAAELEALDAHLKGQHPDPVLDTIADEVRANAPRMSPSFAERLDAAVAEGFVASDPTPRSRLSWRPPLSLATGSMFAAFLALVVGIGLSSGGSGNDDASVSNGASALTKPSADSARESAAGGSSASGTAATPAPPQPSALRSLAHEGDAAAGDVQYQRTARSKATGIDTSEVVPPPGAGPRRVQRAADLTISTPIAKLQDTADGVTAVADRLGGYVYDSNVSASGENGQATFDLRIPTSRLDDAMAALSRLGHVRSRTETSRDITARFSTALSRLHDARAERQALLRALADATTQQEIDSIRARLDIARHRIVAAKSELFAARKASNLARVGVTVLGVSGDDEGAAGGGDGSWTPGQALKDAVKVLSVAAGVVIVGLAGGIPAAALLALLALAWRAHRRRQRELALDAPAAAV